MRILTIDIGGTAVKYGIFYKDNAEFGKFSVTDKNGTEDVPGALCNFADRIKPEVIAISSPGPFDFQTGTSHMKHKLSSMYNISLKSRIRDVLSEINVYFIHDATAFALGAMYEMPELKNMRFAAVMLGTGLGYIYSDNGKIHLDSSGTPENRLWCKPLINGICEDYVSTEKILIECKKSGYPCKSVKAAAHDAIMGNDVLKQIFGDYGIHLGMCVSLAMKDDDFEILVIGGRISNSWELIKNGFETNVRIPYKLVGEPSRCALYGLKEYALKQIGGDTNE